MRPHEHLGIAEIAERMGLSRQRVHQLLLNDSTFPKPVVELSAGKIWHGADVLPWIEARLASKKAAANGKG